MMVWSVLLLFACLRAEYSWWNRVCPRGRLLPENAGQPTDSVIVAEFANSSRESRTMRGEGVSS